MQQDKVDIKFGMQGLNYSEGLSKFPMKIEEEQKEDYTAQKKVSLYSPLQIHKYEVVGIPWAMEAMRIPKENSTGDTRGYGIGEKDEALARSLVIAGDSHAKAIRGINVYMKITCQTGWLIEFETYRHGVECLSTTSSMHNELKGIAGPELADKKQRDLPEKQYTRILTISYQALRHIYLERRHHRHPDWHILCNWIEKLPYAESLIMARKKQSNDR